ncbi:MAG: PAS domain-containing protein [Desulfuromonadales bacterium]|nr:PAS domain-containing protein [Desulfuromonadales bacterium]
MQADDHNLTISGEPIDPNFLPGKRKRAFWLGLAIIGVVALATIFWVAWGLEQREKQFETDLSRRLDLIAGSQVQLTEALLQTVVDQANRVINAEVFKLYAAEVHLLENDISLLVSGPLPGSEKSEELVLLAEQLPMMQNLLLEFTRISGYLGGRVVNRNGTVFIATDARTTPLRIDQQELIRQALQQQTPRFGPLRHTENGLTLDAYLPIMPPQTSDLAQAPVAVLVLSKAVGKRLDELRTSSLMEPGERIRWLQQTADGFQELVPWLPSQLQKITTPPELNDKQQLPFAIRPALGGEQKVYSVGKPVTGPDWWVIVEADYRTVRQGLSSLQKSQVGIAALLILFFSVTFGAVWAIFVSSHEHKVARHFEQLAQQIDKQRQLLDQINDNIADYITLTDLQGRYQYVNPAFATAVDRTPRELIGLDTEAVFGYDTARRLENADQQVLTQQTASTFSETIYLQSVPHHLQISKVPLRDSTGKVSGIVSVIRDVTELFEVQQRQQQATHKSIEALVRAIELTDPYLAGHSRLMGAFAVEVAKALNAADAEVASVETAANLCQIGKLFIDRELLFKATPLTEEEKRRMEQHIEHAGKILRDIDFGLPIYETVTQMNECPDGSGYPRGLTGNEIIMPARILAVVNSFCAMVQPRAYRSARPINEALQIMTSAGEHYDQRVVAALEEVVHSALGEKLLAGLKS